MTTNRTSQAVQKVLEGSLFILSGEKHGKKTRLAIAMKYQRMEEALQGFYDAMRSGGYVYANDSDAMHGSHSNLVDCHQKAKDALAFDPLSHE